jgi:hypothetical protein
MAQVGVARFLLFVSVAGGCASADPVKVRISQPTGLNVSLGSFARVLVAGFIPNGIDQIDLNWETVRLLQVHLRTKDALTVIASEPLPLMELARSSSRRVQEAGAADDIFTNAAFWKRIGKEYGEPLIVTGTVIFKDAGSRYSERTLGRRTVVVWRRGFSLRLQLILINGTTGEVIDSTTFGALTQYATTGRESALSLYFELMERMMPMVSGTLRHKPSQVRVLLK